MFTQPSRSEKRATDREQRRSLLSPIASGRSSAVPLLEWSFATEGASSSMSNLCNLFETASSLREPVSPVENADSDDELETRPPSPIPSPFLAASGETALLPRCHMAAADLLDMNCVDASVVAGLLTHEMAHSYERIIIIDARFNYEYEGGHIRGAINVTSVGALIDLLFSSEPRSLLFQYLCHFPL